MKLILLCLTILLSSVLSPYLYGQPNIVLFVSDDMGWNDVGYHGGDVETPSIDTLVEEGLELDRFYVHPICSPTRTALMTARSPARFGITGPLSNGRGVPLDEHFMSESFQRAGYQTFAVGKWHLGAVGEEYSPLSRGFEHFYGHRNGMIDYYEHTHQGELDWERNGELIEEEGYSTDLIANESVRLLKEREPDRPIFLYVPFNAPHGPFQAPGELTAKYESKGVSGRDATRFASIESMDRAIGRILETLDEEELALNTLVMFFCDNGGKGQKKTKRNEEGLGLRGGKGELYEGGIRVPAVIRWPLQIQAGSKSDSFVSVLDLFPTFAAAANVPILSEAPLDGTNRWAALQSGITNPEPIVIAGGRGTFAVIQDPLKLVSGPNGLELFDVRQDPTESEDLADAHPESVSQLKSLLESLPYANSTEGGSPKRKGKGGKQKKKS